MTSTTRQWTDDAADRLLDHLQNKKLAITPKRVVVSEEVDPIGLDAWRLLLVLEAPKAETWDRAEVFTTRRTAVAAFDDFAANSGHTLPGYTIAFVTTDEAHSDDIAPEDVPEPGEDPGHDA